MGDVLVFEKSRRSFRRMRESEVSGGAQILFFTGVRYERYDVAPAAPVSVDRGRAPVKRKRSPKPNGKKRA